MADGFEIVVVVCLDNRKSHYTSITIRHKQTYPNRTPNSMYCCGDVVRGTRYIPWNRTGTVVSGGCFVVTRSFDGHWTVM